MFWVSEKDDQAVLHIGERTKHPLMMDEAEALGNDLLRIVGRIRRAQIRAQADHAGEPKTDKPHLHHDNGGEHDPA